MSLEKFYEYEQERIYYSDDGAVDGMITYTSG